MGNAASDSHTEPSEDMAIPELRALSYAARGSDPIGNWLHPHEATLVLLLAFLAAVRVFLFSAAFPFWNNVDEPQHFDAVFKYAQGRLPRADESRFAPDASAMIVLYGSPEYVMARPPGQVPTPAGRAIEQLHRPEVRQQIAQFSKLVNSESNSWPSYYLLAGGWFRLGRLFGMSGPWLLYWLRFLSPLLYGLTVLGAWRYVCRAYPQDTYLRVGAPLLLAVFPQDVFYGVNADVLSPLIGACVLALMLRVSREPCSLWWYLLAGLAVALGVLIKATNLVMFVPLMLATLAVGTARSPRFVGASGGLRLLLCWVAAVVPVGAWLIRNYYFVGDWLAAREKLVVLGWHFKPVDEWHEHPLISAGGSFTFVRELVETSWRGELMWAGERIAAPVMDYWYVGSTVVFLLAAVAALWRHRADAEPGERLANRMNLSFVTASVLLLAALSLLFDFGPSHYPSATHPYFTSGRLISGALVSFCILYLQGLRWCLRPISASAAYLVLLLLAAFLLLGEIYLSTDVFRSPYNWYHLTR